MKMFMLIRGLVGEASWSQPLQSPLSPLWLKPCQNCTARTVKGIICYKLHGTNLNLIHGLDRVMEKRITEISAKSKICLHIFKKSQKGKKRKILWIVKG